MKEGPNGTRNNPNAALTTEASDGGQGTSGRLIQTEKGRHAGLGLSAPGAGNRCQTRVQLEGKAITAAKFPEIKTWETFDPLFNPRLDFEGLSELKSLAFVRNNQIIQFLGSPGTGKSHLATALGVLAVHHGHRVYWTSAKKLQRQIIEAKLRNNLDDLFRKILAAKLWIYDDFGVVTYSREVAEEVFDLLDRRKHSSALILTSNRDVSEWPSVFPDLVLANATIDRMFEQARTFVFSGPSHRLKGKIRTTEVDDENSND